MTLTVNKQPPAVALLGDGLIFKINTDNQYSDAGSLAYIELLFSDSGTMAGESFEITAYNQALAFSFVAAPDETGFQLTYRPAGMSLADFVDQVAAEMAQVYLLYTYYDITTDHNSGSRLIIKSKYKGSTYNVNLTNTSTAAITADDYGLGDKLQLRDNYKILMQAELIGAVENTILGTEAIAPDNDGNVIFDLQEYYADRLDVDFIWPETTQLKSQLKTDAVAKAIFNYAEYYGGKGYKLNQVFSQQVPLIILPGGTSWRDKAFYNEYGSAYYVYEENDKRFLTWSPAVKKTSRTAREKLYFYFHDAGLTVDLKVKLYFDNGTGLLISHISGLKPDHLCMYEFVVSYKAMGLEDYEVGKKITSYEVYLESAGNAISEVKTFEIDQQSHFKERVFLFQNSFRTYDTLRCTGIFEKNSEFNRTLIEIEDNLDYTFKNRQKKDVFIEREHTYSANTGWIDAETKAWLDEFVSSQDAYEVKGDLIFPIVLTSKKIFQKRDDETLYNLEFEYMRAYTDEYCSSQLPDGDIFYEFLLDENDEILTDAGGAPILDY